MKKCPVCEKGELMKGELIKVNDIVSEFEGHFFIESGERCSFCSEEFVNEREGQKTVEIARRLGIWGTPLKLHRKLSKSGRGTILRISLDIEKGMNLRGEESVLISKIGKNKLLVEIGT